MREVLSLDWDRKGRVTPASTPRPRKHGLELSCGVKAAMRAAVERRKARAPEARSGGNIWVRGAPPCPKRERMATFAGVARRQDNCAFRRSASLHLGGPFVGIAWQSSGAQSCRENGFAFTSPRRGEHRRPADAVLN